MAPREEGMGDWNDMSDYYFGLQASFLLLLHVEYGLTALEICNSGSSVYSPGIMEAMQYFNVAQVPATLGLSLFVAGYGYVSFGLFVS